MQRQLARHELKHARVVVLRDRRPAARRAELAEHLCILNLTVRVRWVEIIALSDVTVRRAQVGADRPTPGW